MRLKLGKLFLSLIFLFVIISFVSANTVSVVPSIINANVGGNFLVNVYANTSTSNLFSLQFDLNYNPSVLTLNSVTEGNFLKSDGATTIFNYSSIGGGLVRGVYDARNKTFADAIPGINGNGSIAILNFTAIGSGNSGLNLSNVIWVNSSILNASVANVVPIVNNGSVAVSVPPQCQLTNADWSTSSTTENQIVTLTVQGLNCNGQSINFTIWEYDGGGEFILGGADDPTLISPLNAIFSSGVATTTWTAEWQSDCGGLCDPPEYSFVSTILTNASNTITSNDPKMIVNKLVSQNEIFIAPNIQNVTLGNSFIVQIKGRVSPGNDLNAIQTDINYNPAILSVNSVTEGTMLNESGTVPTFFGYTLSSGLIYNLYVARNSSNGTTASEGTIAIINFTAIGGGTSYINISNALWANSTVTNISVGQPPYIATNGSVVIIGGDITAPIISNGLPQSILPAGTTSTPISVTTNEAATCRWSSTSGVAYASMTNTFAGAGTTSHTSTRSGLSDGGSYTTYVRCQDSLGNTNTADYSFTFNVGSCTPTITVDSTYTGYNISSIDDGIVNAFGGTATTWASWDNSSTASHWIEKTFCSPTTYSNATIWWAWNNFQLRYMTSQEVYVQYYDGVNWQNVTLIPFTVDNLTMSNTSFSPVTANRWRLYQPANRGPPTYLNTIWLTEIEFANVAGTNNPPVVSSVVLNASSGSNLDSDNLTVSFVASDSNLGDSVSNITDWRINTQSLAVLNMPFDTNVSSTAVGAIKDYSTRANNGQLGGGNAANSSTWIYSSTNRGEYSFDGTSDYILVPNSPSLDVVGAISVEMWISVPAISSDEVTFAKLWTNDSYTSPWYQYGMELNGNGAVKSFDCFFGSVGGVQELVSSTTSIVAGTLYHIVCQNNGTVSRIYVNGVLENSVVDSNGGIVARGTNLTIGRGPTGTPQWFNGNLYDFKIYNRFLSSEQIRQDYLSGVAGNKIINNQETTLGQNWTVAVTPSDSKIDGTTVLSNQITIGVAGSAVCGNNVVEGTEQCDGTNLSSQTCISQGYTGGTLSCTSSCTFNVTACTTNPPYDVNLDGFVNVGDLSAAALSFGSSCTGPSWCTRRDVNQNGVVNIQDLSLIGLHFT
ncbi:MAG: LamG-like jellyroll fold domain-containing protein [Nanoarchaeota archaeon]